MGDSDSLEGVAKIEENKGVKLGLQPVKENEPHIELETARPTGKLKTLDELSSKLNPIPWASKSLSMLPKSIHISFLMLK
jgi:hypothetical protein